MHLAGIKDVVTLLPRRTGAENAASPSPEEAPEDQGSGGNFRRLRSWRIPLYAVLLIGFVGLVTASGGGVLWLSLASAERSTAALLRERAELTIQNVVGHMKLHLDQPREQASSLAQLIAGDIMASVPASLGLGTVPRLRDAMLASMTGVPQVRALAFLTMDGRSALWFERDDASMRIAVSERPQAPELRSVVEETRVSEGPYWGKVIWSSRLQRPFLNLRTPVRRDDGTGSIEAIGVLVSFVALSDLSHMLAEGRYGEGDNTFILVGRDAVLAHPNLMRALPPLSAAHPIPALDEVDDPVLAGLWSGRTTDGRLLDRVFGDALGHLARISGVDYVFLYRELADFGETPWIIGRHFRLADIDAELRRIATTAFWGLFILIGVALLALLLARLLGRPVLLLAQSATRVAKLELRELEPLPRSGIREFDAATTAFNSMTLALRWFESYVPKTLVRTLMEAGHGTQPPSEERSVTVLFTDIEGFSGLAERLAAADAADLLNHHFGQLVGCIEAESGIVDKYIGDSVMAFWGAPSRHEDDADRACRAALAIADAVDRDNAERRRAGLTPLRVRVGIHTGPAIVGNIGAPGRVNYTAIGDTVNVARRIEEIAASLAIPGEDVTLVVSAATAQRVRSQIPFDELGTSEVRGRRGSVALHRLRRPPVGEPLHEP